MIKDFIQTLDQQVRGAIVLPHGTGKTVRVLAICKPEKEDEARAAGAEFVGGNDMIRHRVPLPDKVAQPKSCHKLSIQNPVADFIFSLRNYWLLHRNLIAHSRGVKHLTKSTFAEIS